MVKACLNGARTREEHAAVPQSPAELAADALAVRRAGAFAVHIHPRNTKGVQTLRAAECDAAVGAIRKAAPGLPVGLSTSEAIDPDPFARAASVQAWRQRPDFISVNISELGWMGIVRAALHSGIGVEAGLSTPAEAEELAGSPFAHTLVRALVEVDGDVEEARAILAFTPRAVAKDWSKLLESAVANAEHNHELDGDDLVIKAAHADEGPTLKRFRPRAMGRATPIRKRTSHLTIALSPYANNKKN